MILKLKSRSLRLKPRESCLPQASRDLRVRMIQGYILQQSKKRGGEPNSPPHVEKNCKPERSPEVNGLGKRKSEALADDDRGFSPLIAIDDHQNFIRPDSWIAAHGAVGHHKADLVIAHSAA